MKSWIDKERTLDVFDIKSDAVKTLVELGIEEANLLYAIKLNLVIILEGQALLC